jgi:hypothetical protein
MDSRAGLSARERELRSRLRQLLDDPEALLHASLITMARVCGNPRCKCALKGEKHRSLYAGQTVRRKTRMRSVPKDAEALIRRWVARYERARELLEALSEEGWQRWPRRRR